MYLDTSALVKLYVAEVAYDSVLAAIQATDLITISVVGYAEARSALARRFGEGRLSLAEYRQVVADLNQDWSAFVHLDVIAQLSHHAGELAEQYGLRGFDAIHLASALHAADMFEDVSFLAFDKRLNDAARKAGLTIYSTSQPG